MLTEPCLHARAHHRHGFGLAHADRAADRLTLQCSAVHRRVALRVEEYITTSIQTLRLIRMWARVSLHGPRNNKKALNNFVEIFWVRFTIY
jgi:hypothetical protein